MDPIAIRAATLQALLPDPALLLRPGASVVARVAARPPGELATLVLAGVPLRAELPEEVAEGQTLRLTVTEVTPERVFMRLEPQPAAATPVPLPPQPPAPAQLPPARVAVQEPPRRRRSAGGEEVASVALTFQSAVLGRLDLRVVLGGADVRAEVRAPAGESFEAARAAAAELRASLQAHVGRTAAVEVTARPEPVDVYA
jgi:hypothetical protein